MAFVYLPLASDDANTTFLPIESDDVVGVIVHSDIPRDGERVSESFVLVPSDGQKDVSRRNLTFDLVGPLDPYSRALTTFLKNCTETMPEGQAVVDGKPSQSTRAWGAPERAAHIVGGQFPGTYFRTHCLVYPLAEPHETFGPEIQIYLFDDGGRQVGTLIGG